MRIFELEEKHSTRSSSPSLSFENSGQSRIENVKKTYITIKMRYDNLYKIGKDISTVTRGLQFSAFGELGALLRRLKGAIEEADIAAESDVVSQGGNDGAGG
ncbi:hypothetical protein K469DRAFT_702102 [Zopfia rhizophila CBS 207.26]|uniref:Uncharacterized protein n=1 Tax=Zopfia rhizophila CBS 207.26 TaxID=1314779 RepID=A0A6A6DB98_9PEZI|nr:hypothetical protein K469DRAFT_702102 [Zopfia rhizophila CBS 207.26]